MSKAQPILVNVVIVSYNVCDFVLEGINSVYSFLKFPFQVILVDNNSTDGTVNQVNSKFPEVKVIANKENKGFSKANNQGFEICNGEFFIMLNPDAALIDESINLLIQELIDHNDENIILGPKIINPDLSFQNSCWKFPTSRHHLIELFFLNSIIHTNTYPSKFWHKKTQVDFLSGACIAFSRNTLNKLGGLDEHLFWMDDVDLCKRNLESGGGCFYFPNATIRHFIGQSSKKNQRVVISNQIISKLKYYKKHQQTFNFSSSVVIFVLQIITRIPLFLALGIFNPFYFKKASAYAYSLKKMFKFLFLHEQAVI